MTPPYLKEQNRIKQIKRDTFKALYPDIKLQDKIMYKLEDEVLKRNKNR